MFPFAARSTGVPVMAAVTASAVWRSCVAVAVTACLAGVRPAFAQSAFQGLGDLPGDLGSHASAVSADGAVVVGFSYYIATDGLLQSHAFRWTEADGIHAVFEGGLDYTSAAFSDDRGTVVGASGGHAFVWRQASGVQDLQTVLSPPAGWTLTEAHGVSADGTMIVGSGSLAGVGAQAWMAALSPGGTPTATLTPSVTFTLTRTPSSTPSVTPSAMLTGCTGDCDGNGIVTTSELISGVNIALANQAVRTCPAFESAAGKVDIVQLVKGVNNALKGCGGR